MEKRKFLSILLIGLVTIGSVTLFILFNPWSGDFDPIELQQTENPDLDGSYTLNWTAAKQNCDYHLYRSTQTFQETNQAGVELIYEGESKEFLEEHMEVGVYFYRVCATLLSKVSQLSNQIQVNVTYPTEIPQIQFEGPSVAGPNISLVWNPVVYASSYILWRSTSNNNNPLTLEPLCTSNITQFEDTEVTPGVYYYAVVASNGQVNTSASSWTQIQVLPEYQKILLDEFPMSLDYLFWKDNPTVEQGRLDSIKSQGLSEGKPFIVPYPNYVHHDHYPATFKWYMYAERHLPIALPCDSYITIDSIHDNSNTTINNSHIMKNLGLTLHLNYYIKIIFDHISINESIYLAVQAADPFIFLYRDYPEKALFLPANTNFGFTHDTYALDFIVDDRTHTNYNGSMSWGLETMKNPYFIFTPTMQIKLDSFYQPQYNAMKESGLYIHGTLNWTNNINRNSSWFGTWWYQGGPFILNSSHHSMGWYSFTGAILNILNINDTETDTFYDYNAGCLGVYVDSDYLQEGYTYERMGIRTLYYHEGANFTSGIIESILLAGGRTGIWYIKYEFIENTVGMMWDDGLKIEYFDNLISAQTGFSENYLYYTRFPDHR